MVLWDHDFIIISNMPCSSQKSLIKFSVANTLTTHIMYIFYVLVKQSSLKELCHRISVFLVTEARWGSPLSNQVRGRCGFVTLR